MLTPEERREKARLAELERMRVAKVGEFIGTSIACLVALTILVVVGVAIYGGFTYAVRGCESPASPALHRGR